MTHLEVIERTVEFVKRELAAAEAGHDWWHIQRVWASARHLAQEEGDVDPLVVELGALLHDIADSKFHGGDEELGARVAGAFLDSLGVDAALVERVQAVVRHVSFKGGPGVGAAEFISKELWVVQDADRLDAMGAIGIARAFSYGGHLGRPFYDPAVPPNPGQSKAEYKKGGGPTINHFYEKLLRLRDLMNTAAGRRLAEERHVYMEGYLAQFYREWEGVG